MNDNLKKGKGVIHTWVDVSTEVEIDIDDLIEQISDQHLLEEVKFRGLLGDSFVSDGMSASTVYDDLKINVLREAYSKYTLEELEQKLK